MTAHSAFRSHWQLNPKVDFLNHGSFGATPTVVLRAQRSLQNALERDPVAFLAPERDLEPKLDAVRHAIAALVQANPENLAFVRNATDGVNAVLRSFPFEPGDEIVVTNYGYNACLNAAKYVADRAGGSVSTVQLPFPVRDAEQIIAAVEAALTKRTRLLMIDHVASPTAVVVPIQQIVTVAHHRGIRVLIDGAHAPGYDSGRSFSSGRRLLHCQSPQMVVCSQVIWLFICPARASVGGAADGDQSCRESTAARAFPLCSGVRLDGDV